MYKKEVCSKKFLIPLISLFLSVNIHAGIKFNEGDINGENEILFTMTHNVPGLNTYSTIFKAKLKNGEPSTHPEILTCYPEHMELLEGGAVLQIRNRYGTLWFDTQKNTFRWKEYAPRIPETTCRTAPYSTSPDGKWMCFIKKQNYASGALTLQNARTGKSLVLDGNAAFSYKSVPVKWAMDSSTLLYEKNGAIYFCNPEALLKDIEVAESYRKIGDGTISSVNWTDKKNLVYIDNDIVYSIGTRELYTRGLYSDIIGKGSVIGRLPFSFTPARDSFSINVDMTAMVLIQSGRHFSLFMLKGRTGDYLDASISRPFAGIQGSFLESEILWPGKSTSVFVDKNLPTVWLRTLPYSSDIPSATVFNINEKFSKIVEIEDSKAPVLSPDGLTCAFFSGTSAFVYDTATWRKKGEASGEQIISAVWENNTTLILGGDKTIRRWRIGTNELETILLSQGSNAQWTDQNLIAAECGNGKSYTFGNDFHWRESISVQKRANKTNNVEYRVFCGDAVNTNFENALYIRTLRGKPVTKPIFSECLEKRAPKKRIALLFDAYENADGLAQILHELGIHNVSGTFFLNGEFIRRYPNETRQITISKNECASLFFSPIPLLDSDFIIDEDFIRRGLARNEDEFFKVTGKELSLLWHAPYYQKSERLVAAAKSAGYTYVEPSLYSFDFVTLEDAATSLGKYYTSAELIDLYIATAEKAKRAIIPITVGISRGTRSEYLYDNLDLLINAILDSGFEIVPLRTLIN